MVDEEPDTSHWISEQEIVELLRARAPDVSWVKEIPDLTLQEIKAGVALLTPEQRATHEARIGEVEADIAWSQRHRDREDVVLAVLEQHGVNPADPASGFTEDTAFDLLHELMDHVREWTRPELAPDAVTLLTVAVTALERVGCQFDMCPGSDVEPQDMLTCHACDAVRTVKQALAGQTPFKEWESNPDATTGPEESGNRRRLEGGAADVDRTPGAVDGGRQRGAPEVPDQQRDRP